MLQPISDEREILYSMDNIYTVGKLHPAQQAIERGMRKALQTEVDFSAVDELILAFQAKSGFDTAPRQRTAGFRAGAC